MKRCSVKFLITSLVSFTVGLISCSKEDSNPLPNLTTNDITGITLSTSKCGGNITSDGGSEVSGKGVCWSSNTSPTINNSKTDDGMGIGNFESNLEGLDHSTTYYVRAYATNKNGTAYGDEKTFTTLAPLYTAGTGVTDVDGNAYNTIILGTQEWMAQNLTTTRYANGDAIANAIDDSDWGEATTGAWCHYNNDSQFNVPFGKLYNWFAVADPRNVCPTGYHPPSDAEWATLETFLGGSGVAGGKMKEIGTEYWVAPNTGATNTSGFNALPGGDRARNSPFEVMGTLGRYWSSTEIDPVDDVAIAIALTYDGEYVGRNLIFEKYGFSVRCVKD